MRLLNILKNKWNSYKYRFRPWILLNLHQRTCREVVDKNTDKILPDEEIEVFLNDFLCALDTRFKKDCLHHIKSNGSYEVYEHGIEVMKEHLNFAVERKPSLLENGGLGVIVTHGNIPPKTVVALYPGTIYKPGDPILLQSIKNPFIFRCLDHVHIDGNNLGLSKFIYRSCCKRDCHFGHYLSDMTWLTDHPVNPLAIGQFVNNQTHSSGANVAYQEFTLPENFPLHLRKYIPNNLYSNENGNIWNTKLIVLVSLRWIHQNEELYSNYFTVIK